MAKTKQYKQTTKRLYFQTNFVSPNTKQSLCTREAK